MVQTVVPFTVQLVKFETTLPFKEVVSRLETQLNKAGCDNILARIRAAKDKHELRSLIENTMGESGFLWFSEIAFHKLIEKPGGLPEPRLVVYAIGNPLYAQPILQNNPFAAYSIPFRLLIAEKPDRNGTIVTYHLPSSIMGHPDGANAPSLKRHTKILDERITRLVRKIVSVNNTHLATQDVKNVAISKL